MLVSSHVFQPAVKRAGETVGTSVVVSSPCRLFDLYEVHALLSILVDYFVKRFDGKLGVACAIPTFVD